MSIQPVPKNPHSSATTAPATPAISSTEALSTLLSMSPEAIARRGVPAPLFSAWVNEFRNGLKDDSLVLGVAPETAWTINSQMGLFLMNNTIRIPDTEQERNKVWQAFSEQFQSMTTKNFWRNPQEIQPLLFNMVLLYSVTLFPPNHPVEAVFLKFIDCFVKAIISKQDSPYFIMNWDSVDIKHTPLRNEVCRYKQLFFLNTEDGWRVGIFDNFPNTPFRLVQFNPNRTKMLILDQERKPIEGTHMIVQANKPTNDDSYRSKAALAQQAIIRTTMCTGMEDLRQGKHNAATFGFSTCLTTRPLKMENFGQSLLTKDNPADKLSPQQVRSALEAAEVLFDTFQDEFASVQSKSYAEPVMFELASPQSAIDHVKIRLNLLLKLQKDPAANADLIVEAAEMMGCDFSEQELQTLVDKKEATITEEGCAISPKAVIDKLVTVAFQTLKAAPKEAAVELKIPVAERKTAQPVPLSTAPKKPKAKKTASPEQQIAAGRQQAVATLEQNRHTTTNTAERPLSEALPQDLSCLGYTPREQSQIASIYEGQPMKATQFTAFAMNLLRKQAQAKGASTSTNTKKGSHPTMHFKRSDGTSGGVTFAVHHGKKDAHGYAPGQRGTLEAIFRI